MERRVRAQVALVLPDPISPAMRMLGLVMRPSRYSSNGENVNGAPVPRLVPRNVPLWVKGACARKGYAIAAVAVDTRSPGRVKRVRSAP